MPDRSRQELINGRPISTQDASLTTVHPDGHESTEATKIYTVNSRADLDALLSSADSKPVAEKQPSFAQRQSELWDEHERLRKGFLADIRAGKSPQEAYDHWTEGVTDHNRRIVEFNREFTAHYFGDERPGPAREFDLDRQRAWAMSMIERKARAAKESTEQSTGMGMGF